MVWKQKHDSVQKEIKVKYKIQRMTCELEARCLVKEKQNSVQNRGMCKREERWCLKKKHYV